MTEDKSDFCETRNKAVVSKDEDVSCWNCLKSEGNNKEPLPLSKVRKQHREKLRLYSFLASQVTKPKAVPLKQRVSENYSVAKKVDEQILQQKSTENYYADNIERHLSNISEKLKASPELGPKTSKVSQSKLLHIENDLYSLADELEESASKLSRVSERAKDVVIKETYTENTNREYKKVSLKPGLSPILRKSPDFVEVQSKVLVESSSPKIKRSIFKDTADVHRYSSVIEFKKRDDIVEELNDDIDIPAISSGRTSSASDKIENASSCGSDSGFADSNTNRELSSPELSVKSERLYKSCLRKDVKALPSLTGDNTIPATSTTSLSIPNTAPIRVSEKCTRWSTLSIHQKPISFGDETYISESVSPGHATLPRRSNSPLPHERDLDRFSLNRSGLQNRSESMASVYSGAGEGMRGNVTVRGDVQFSLLYNYRLGALEVGVRRCRDLAPVDVKRNRSDPYVKVYLLPDKSKTGKRKTKVKKNTLNPIFEETLSFVQPLASLSSRTLWLSVWHADMFGRNDFLGEVTLPLADVVFDDPAPMWYKLHERTEQFDEQQGTRGDLIIGLKFELSETGPRAKGTLHVLVKEAKNVVATKPNGLADVFCKSYLLPERGRLAKQKTNVCRRTLNPRWEHTFTYRGLTMQELSTRALELSLWDRDRLASNDFMGAVRLSLGTGTYMGANVNWMDSVGKEVSLWQDMMQNPNIWVERSLPLRPQLNN